jgi:hypothetical protein
MERPEKANHYLASSHDFDRTLIVALITMRMLQVILNEVIDMTRVFDRGVAAEFNDSYLGDL